MRRVIATGPTCTITYTGPRRWLPATGDDPARQKYLRRLAWGRKGRRRRGAARLLILPLLLLLAAVFAVAWTADQEELRTRDECGLERGWTGWAQQQ